MAVITEGVTDVAQFTRRVAPAVELCIVIGPWDMSRVAARLTLEVVSILIVAVFAHKAFVACPSLDQRAIHAKVPP
jgi:hypothetical protein